MSKKWFFLIPIVVAFWECETEPYSGGKRIYKLYCENCHMVDGTGLPPLYLPIQESSYLSDRINELPCLIRNGRKSLLMENVEMPSHNLSEIDLTNLINYMNHKWGNVDALNLNELKEAYRNCESIN